MSCRFLAARMVAYEVCNAEIIGDLLVLIYAKYLNNAIHIAEIGIFHLPPSRALIFANFE
jgi:hypothetical protein